MTAQAAFRPGQPLFATEYWPGWFDHWGHPHETRSTAEQVKDLEYILGHHASLNIYMFHGGTSFGFMAGSSITGSKFLPDVTSYDYDAPLDEAGRPTAKYMAYRAVFQRFSATPLPPIPSSPRIVTVAPFALTHVDALWEHLHAPLTADTPMTMEQLGQSYGYLLYRHTFQEAAEGVLHLHKVHDYAQVFVDGHLIATLDRRKAATTDDDWSVPLHINAGARLDILVANDGRINSSHAMRGEAMGLVGAETLDEIPVRGWQHYRLPFDDVSALRPAGGGKDTGALDAPHLAFGSFSLQETGGMFLDVHALGKGAVWINGHAVGRYWHEGPQTTLFVPASWLRRGRNDVVVFDMLAGQAKTRLAGLAAPVLNAPTPSEVHPQDENVPAKQTSAP